MARNTDESQTVAHLLVYLLNMLHRVGRSIVFGAIGDGVGRSLRSLEDAWTRLERRAVEPRRAAHAAQGRGPLPQLAPRRLQLRRDVALADDRKNLHVKAQKLLAQRNGSSPLERKLGESTRISHR